MQLEHKGKENSYGVEMIYYSTHSAESNCTLLTDSSGCYHIVLNVLILHACAANLANNYAAAFLLKTFFLFVLTYLQYNIVCIPILIEEPPWKRRQTSKQNIIVKKKYLKNCTLNKL